MSDDVDEVVDCECCHANVKLKKYLRNSLGETQEYSFCDLCAWSMSSILHQHNYYSVERKLASIICYVGNEILKEIKKESHE